MDYKLNIFKHDAKKGWVYHFAVVDKSKEYPANFICMLPTKPVKTKLNHGFGGKFGDLFGDKSMDVAFEFLSEALKTEHDKNIQVEIKKRLELIGPKQVNLVICCQCKKPFQQQKRPRYKRYVCEECLKHRQTVNV
jgi:hypothetical protein